MQPMIRTSRRLGSILHEAAQKLFQIFSTEIKKSKTYSGWCPFKGLTNGTTLMQIQSGRTVPTYCQYKYLYNESYSCSLRQMMPTTWSTSWTGPPADRASRRLTGPLGSCQGLYAAVRTSMQLSGPLYSCQGLYAAADRKQLSIQLCVPWKNAFTVQLKSRLFMAENPVFQLKSHHFSVHIIYKGSAHR
jgi:hypothetical protein